MKKTGIEATSVAFAVILTIFRIPIKLFFIDPATGFYRTENMLGIFFNLTFFAFLALAFWITQKNKEDFAGKMRVGSTRCVLFSISAVGIFILSIMNLLSLSDEDFGYANQVPKLLVYPAHILGIAAGLLLLFLSVSLFSGAVLKRGPQLLSLMLPIWCSLLSLCDFLSFRYTVYASDELMGTIFMISSILFFLYLSRSLIIDEENKGYLFFASAAFITGSAIAVPQLIAILLLKREMSGPNVLQCFMTLFVSVVAFCFIFPPSKKRKDNR